VIYAISEHNVLLQALLVIINNLQPFERISCKQIHDNPGTANTPIFCNNFPNTTCFPPNTRENFLLDVSKNRDTEAAQEPNLASTFSRQILQNFRSELMRKTRLKTYQSWPWPSFRANTHMTVYWHGVWPEIILIGCLSERRVSYFKGAEGSKPGCFVRLSFLLLSLFSPPPPWKARYLGYIPSNWLSFLCW